MKRALSLAQRGAGRTSPNPLVGAVIVKSGKVISECFHEKAGLAHAEITALRRAGDRARKATLYVNLEPCNHVGKTPPCTDAIIAGGIKRVVIGMRDPNPVNNGGGIRKLKRNGIKVEEGILKRDSEALNRPFAKFITKKIPYITVKVAQSLDGKIATKSGDSKWISGRCSRTFAHRLRSRADAVLVGINTVMKDDPLLTPRVVRFAKARPKKIVIDTCLKIPLRSRLLEDPESVIVAATTEAPKKKLEELRRRKIDVIVTRKGAAGVDLLSLMRQLAGRGIVHILVEGGGGIIASFLKKGLVDEMYFFISSKIIGGRDAVTSVEGEGIEYIRQASQLKSINIKRFKNDTLIWGQVPSGPKT